MKRISFIVLALVALFSQATVHAGDASSFKAKRYEVAGLQESYELSKKIEHATIQAALKHFFKVSELPIPVPVPLRFFDADLSGEVLLFGHIDADGIWVADQITLPVTISNDVADAIRQMAADDEFRALALEYAQGRLTTEALFANFGY